MRRAIAIAVALSIHAGATCAATRDLAPIVLPKAAAPGKALQPFLQVNAPVVALMHVRAIDGTGAPAHAESRTSKPSSRMASATTRRYC